MNGKVELLRTGNTSNYFRVNNNSGSLQFLFTPGDSNDENGLINAKIETNKFSDLTISYNGDIWLDNYKRGKIPLTTITNKLKYDMFETFENIGQKMFQTNIETYNGFANIKSENNKYVELKSLDDREFVCWVNKYGEVVSLEPKFDMYVFKGENQEYTAIYEDELGGLFKLPEEDVSDWDYVGYVGYNSRFCGEHWVSVASDAIVEEDDVFFDVFASYYWFDERKSMKMFIMDPRTKEIFSAHVNNKVKGCLPKIASVFISENPENLKYENLINGGVEYFSCQDFFKSDREDSFNNNFCTCSGIYHFSKDEIKEKLGIEDNIRLYYRLIVTGYEIDWAAMRYGSQRSWLEPTIKFFDL